MLHNYGCMIRVNNWRSISFPHRHLCDIRMRFLIDDVSEMKEWLVYGFQIHIYCLWIRQYFCGTHKARGLWLSQSHHCLIIHLVNYISKGLWATESEISTITGSTARRAAFGDYVPAELVSWSRRFCCTPAFPVLIPRPASVPATRAIACHDSRTRWNPYQKSWVGRKQRFSPG